MSRSYDICLPSSTDLTPGSLGVYLGSFDPPHRGHRFVVETLLARCDGVLLLLPASHFSKKIAPPHNATLEQRLSMLRPWHQAFRGRLEVGVAQQVLYLLLDEALRDRHPGRLILFGMGDDSWTRLAHSRRYFRGQGLAWGADQQLALRDLQRRCVVFGRHSRGDGLVEVPPTLRSISSTQVRAAVSRWRADDGRPSDDLLDRLVEPSTRQLVLAQGLYPPLAESEAA